MTIAEQGQQASEVLDQIGTEARALSWRIQSAMREARLCREIGKIAAAEHADARVRELLLSARKALAQIAKRGEVESPPGPSIADELEI